MQLIHINSNLCNLCYACVRVCPVKALQVKQEFAPPIVDHDRCIGCGACLSSCATGALTYSDGTKKTKELLTSEDRVAIMVAPSISGEFSDIADYRKFVRMIRQLGFEYVVDVSFGVDMVSLEYKKLFDNFKGIHYITSKCPSVVAYIEKFNTPLVQNLAPIVTPMVATARIVHQTYGDDVRIVYVGPCISAKYEAAQQIGDATIDSVITFIELRQLFQDYHIRSTVLEFSEFDAPSGHKGGLFPINTGLLAAGGIKNDVLDGKIVPAVGWRNVKSSLSSFLEYDEEIQRHFDLFFCEGCTMGPGMSQRGSKFLRHTLTTEYVKKRLVDFDKEAWEKSVDSFKNIDYSRGFFPDNQCVDEPSKEHVEQVLKVLMKDGEDNDSGCESCGYASCREFAVAVAKGITRPEMCLTYSLKTQNQYIKTLKNTNDKLARTEKALKESEKVARREQVEAEDTRETFTVMLQKLPVGVVIVNQELGIIHSNAAFIDLLGEDARMIDEVIPGLKGADLKTLVPYSFYNLFSFVLKNGETVSNKDTKVEDDIFNVSVFTIRAHKVVGAVVRDLRSPEVRREQVIRRVTEVIDENLEMVQKIGFLLGEGASTTEKMLNSIITTYRDDE